MKLTKYQKEAFVRAVMQDVPNPRGPALEKEVQDALVKAMSPLCRKLYKQCPNALTNKSSSRFSARSYKHYIVGDANFEEVTKPFEEKVSAYVNSRTQLKGVVDGCSTLKQLKTMLPEFEKYMPTETQPTRNLPAITNVVSSLVALGWKG